MPVPDRRFACGRLPGDAPIRSPGTVLVVDDDAAVLATLPRLLETRGWRVETAAGLEEAFRRVGSCRFDLVITDLRLGGPPDSSGFRLISRIRADAPETPVVLLTSYDAPEIRAEALRRGAVEVWHKALGPAEIVARACALLHARPDRDH